MKTQHKNQHTYITSWSALLVAVFCVWGSAVSVVHAQTREGSEAPLTSTRTSDVEPTVRVSATHHEPFVIIEDGVFDGFAVDLWEAIAAENDWSSTMTETDSLITLLKAPQDASADIALGGIAITSDRKALMDFSTPIFEGGLQIVSQRQQPFRFLFDALFLPEGHLILSVAFLVFLFLAHILWASERGGVSRIRARYAPGIFDAFWWMATFGGFGRALPVSGWGRSALLLWMCVLTVVLMLYVAIITTSLTAQDIRHSIRSHHDLHGKSVGVVQGSVAEAFTRTHRIDVVQYRDTRALLSDVAEGYIDAAVHDAPLVRYHIARYFPGRLTVVGERFEHSAYGIAVPKDSPLLEEVDVSLLRLRERGVYDDLYHQWFGEK